MLRTVRVEMELDRRIAAELQGADANPFRPDVNLFNDGRQETSDTWEPLHTDSV